MLASKLLSAAGGTETLWVDEVFQTHLYTGNGSTQTITNGIDLAGKGGLVWCKQRSSTENHFLFDTNRGINKYLQSTNTSGQTTVTNTLPAFNSTGFDFGSNGPNTSSTTYASWTFRKAAKFFDCGTYTGNGVAGRQIPHSLGVAPGMVIVKQTSGAGGPWFVRHRSLGGVPIDDYGTNDYITLNSTAAASGSVNIKADSAAITVNHTGDLNTNGATYVWYAFAHDTSAEGIIQCGSWSQTGSGATVNLGWEPQFVLFKQSDGANNWRITDTMRGATASNTNQILAPNSTAAESAEAGVTPTATGFNVSTYFGTSGTFIYLAIRRPNKPPTSGTQVYNAIARTGTGAAATVTGVGFAPDLVTGFAKSSGPHKNWIDRLRGGTLVLESDSTGTEATYATAVTGWINDGAVYGADASNIINTSGINYINHFFRRAPGVFDVVCWTGDGASTRALNHSLSVAPQLIIGKGRSAATGWFTYLPSGNVRMQLNSTAASPVYGGAFAGTTPTSTQFSFDVDLNASSSTYIAYLFASSPGISKVGSYTGNGSSQTIDCGFSTGARFVLIKRTDSTGDWYVWDSVRGIVAANDPHLSLNTTAAEVTSNDSIDPTNAGFVVNQVAATNVNVTSATYIYLAYA